MAGASPCTPAWAWTACRPVALLIQEAASEFLKRKPKEQEIEDYFAAYERVPLTEDERTFDEWKAQHWAELFVDETELRRRPKK